MPKSRNPRIIMECAPESKYSDSELINIARQNCPRPWRLAFIKGYRGIPDHWEILDSKGRKLTRAGKLLAVSVVNTTEG